MGTVNSSRGELTVGELKFAIVAARFNEEIVESLLAGAVATFKAQGASEQQVTVVRVPGAFELPLVVSKLASSKRYDAVIALGAVIRGGTPHFEYVCHEAASGLTRAALDTGVPVVFGVLTTDNLQQAQERAGSGPGNKGAEAALVAIEMANLMQRLDQ
ncbi:MAG: 6,7-dimethyl-8-ribityllumazine synthase [Steroidobacteraceae bacterium]